MINIDFKNIEINLALKQTTVESIKKFSKKYLFWFLVSFLTGLSTISYLVFLDNNLGLAYNDARSHLDIGRRVVEGLKPGLAQLGSVWLPLPHLLMVPTIWNDFMWHSGLSGALQSMIAFVATALLIYAFLTKLGVGLIGRTIAVFVFAINLNSLYMQSTAMTELLLMATMTAGVFELMLFSKNERMVNLVRSAFWIMLSTLIRYDGWLLLTISGFVIGLITFKRKGYKVTEGLFVAFCTLGGFGIVLWFLWNQLIFKDALYFAFGPFSARVQQHQIEEAGLLAAKGDLLLSLKIYFYALVYNANMFTVVLGSLGAILLWIDKTIKTDVKIAVSALFAPLIFNVLALYLGHSVLFVQGISGNTWFNVRYGLMMLPTFAVFTGFLIDRLRFARFTIIGLLIFVAFFTFQSSDAVTIDDARVGSSQKNVKEVSSWLSTNAKDKLGFVLISAASHDAIIFSSGLPMKRFIHEGTGKYWESTTSYPDRWARWIVMRTNDVNDLTFKTVSKTGQLKKYNLVGSYPFADIYELKPEYLKDLETKPVFGKQK